MPVTLREIVKTARVSVPTASRALHNHPQVGSSTPHSVLRIARQPGHPMSRLRSAHAGPRTVLLVHRHPDWKNQQEDVAIIGFHDDELARFTDPTLTAVQVDMSLVGQIAARWLAMMLGSPGGQAWCVTVPASLTIRESA